MNISDRKLLEMALEAVGSALEDAYSRAGLVCCNRPGSECCGSPAPEWSEADAKIMDVLGPIHKAIEERLQATDDGTYTTVRTEDLVQIRDSTYRSAVVLRAMVGDLLDAQAQEERLQAEPDDGGFYGRMAARLLDRVKELEAQKAINWRAHVEQRMMTWKQRCINSSGDRLALEDFMDEHSIEDLIDFVCDEFAEERLQADEKEEPVAVLHAIADYIEPHWRGAGLTPDCKWLFDEIVDKMNRREEG